MSLRFLSPALTRLTLMGLVLISVGEPALAQTQTLTVCTDPHNLPFSDAQGRGFENKVAALVARDLGMQLRLFPQRLGRGFVRNVLNEGKCDLLPGIPEGWKQVSSTTPYYHSSYVFISKASRRLDLDSLASPALKSLKVGVQIGDDEYAPPALLLARNGYLSGIVGFDTVEDPDSILRALQNGAIDVAVVWGPLAGSYRRRDPSLRLLPIKDKTPAPFVLSFAISMGVRKRDTALRDRINVVLARRKREIDRILQDAGVPLTAAPVSKDKEAD
jgi:mxaJ protein